MNVLLSAQATRLISNAGDECKLMTKVRKEPGMNNSVATH
jgi:hypothetical protein